MDIETALTKTGYGRFHYKILTVCALSLLSVGLQSNISSFIFQSIQCELNLTSFELGILNVAYLFGGSLSCFLWGIIADNSGRRPTLIIGHLLNVVVTLLTAFIDNVSILIGGRFLTGFLSSAPTSIVFSYLSEFQPNKYRSIILSILSLFFTLAYLILPLLSWLILPIDLHLNLSFLLISPWRLLLVIIVIPELIVGWSLIYLPETPIYCLNQGDLQETLNILKLMFTINTGENHEKYPVRNLVYKRKNQIEIVDGERWKITRIFGRILQQFKELFQPPLLQLTSLSCGVNFASLFGLYGLGLWIPEFFVRFQLYENQHPDNATVTIKELTQMKISTTTNIECNQSLDNSVIRNTIIVGIVSLICSLITIAIAKRVHLKFIVFISMLTGSICTFLLYYLNTSLQNLIITSIFQSTMIIGNVQIGSLVTNLFPTDIIGSCLSLVMFSGRLGAIVSNLFFSYFMDDYCEIPIIVVAICLLIGSVLCYLIPKNNNNNNCNNNNNNCIEKSIEISVIKGES